MTYFCQEFFFSLLSSATTKREAKSYLSRFKTPKEISPTTLHEASKSTGQTSPTPQYGGHSGVNLGAVFGGSRAVGEVPVFRQGSTPDTTQPVELATEKLHVALVKIRQPQSLDDQTLGGIARTLSQLSTLGMACCVVLDPGITAGDLSWRRCMSEQAGRMSLAIDVNHGPGSRYLNSVISLPSSSSTALTVLSRKVLLSPLRRGRILVTLPVGYTEDTQHAVSLSADDVVLTMAMELAGLDRETKPDDNPLEAARRFNQLQEQVSLDRLIILDPLGGIPSLSLSPQKSHVFVNLEQEYDDIVEELSETMEMKSAHSTAAQPTNSPESGCSFRATNPLTKREVMSFPRELQHKQALESSSDSHSTLERHLNNLNLLQHTLSYLPPSSSGIITTPHDAANSAKTPKDRSQFSAVRTRRQRNPLLHNLLTDKPVHSASLPLGRLGVTASGSPGTSLPVTHSTFVKKGMPLTVFPNPRITPWSPFSDGANRIALSDPQIDLPRLVYLIEDSFNRKLDVQHYLNRVNNRLAGLIIAGEYEGGAILTWETPPGVPDDGSPESLSRMVPYLDKFAVLKRSQGAGGVADIVFNAMVRTCFPKGVCWRSRRNNPVNKWYFERARGTWKLPDTNWTMFWTTCGIPENSQAFQDYEGVCRGVEPSWADKKGVVD